MTTSNTTKCAWCGQSFAPGALDYVDHHNGSSTAICEQCLDNTRHEPDTDSVDPAAEWLDPWWYLVPANDNGTLWCA